MGTVTITKKETAKKHIKKTNVNIFLREKFKCPKGTTLDIRHLYDNTYRLNYWGKHIIHLEKGETNGILYSIWVVVKPTKNGFKIVEKDDK